MASVYVATMRLARGVSRRVALKRVHPHLAEDAKFVTMFVDEARLASELSHPGIVPVLDALEVGGELILVLEYIAGWDLDSLIRAAEGPIDPGIAIRIARLGLDTLAYVHNARDVEGRALDIVHRDVSPSNILIGEDDSVRLLDFGIAKAARRSVRTATRTLKGKLAYMSPEQASGDPLDGRSDVYAMGLTLLEMLLGERVNNSEDDAKVLAQARRPVLPSLDALSPETQDVAARLLEPDVSKRPHAAEAARMVATLEHPGAADATRALIVDRLGASSRPLVDRNAQKHSVDAALAALLDDDDEGTAEQPIPEASETPARSLLVAREPAVDVQPSEKPRRLGWVALGVLLLAGGGVAWTTLQSSDPAETTPNVTALPSFVNVATTPPGATIWIAGQQRGETPSVVELNDDDPHSLTLKLDDYVELTAEFEPVVGETVAVARNLQRLPGQLRVQSQPEGATVTLNDEQIGTTPLSVNDLPRETLSIVVQLDGYTPITREVDLDVTRESTLVVELRRVDVRPGTLFVNSNVPNSIVEVDGRVVSRHTPWRGPARPGSRQVTVRAPDGRRDTKTVRVRPGATARAGFFL